MKVWNNGCVARNNLLQRNALKKTLFRIYFIPALLGQRRNIEKNIT